MVIAALLMSFSPVACRNPHTPSTDQSLIVGPDSAFSLGETLTFKLQDGGPVLSWSSENPSLLVPLDTNGTFQTTGIGVTKVVAMLGAGVATHRIVLTQRPAQISFANANWFVGCPTPSSTGSGTTRPTLVQHDALGHALLPSAPRAEVLYESRNPSFVTINSSGPEYVWLYVHCDARPTYVVATLGNSKDSASILVFIP